MLRIFRFAVQTCVQAFIALSFASRMSLASNIALTPVIACSFAQDLGRWWVLKNIVINKSTVIIICFPFEKIQLLEGASIFYFLIYLIVVAFQ